MNSEYLDENDISWLTQVSSIESQKANFDMSGSYEEDADEFN